MQVRANPGAGSRAAHVDMAALAGSAAGTLGLTFRLALRVAAAGQPALPRAEHGGLRAPPNALVAAVSSRLARGFLHFLAELDGRGPILWAGRRRVLDGGSRGGAAALAASRPSAAHIQARRTRQGVPPSDKHVTSLPLSEQNRQ